MWPVTDGWPRRRRAPGTSLAALALFVVLSVACGAGAQSVLTTLHTRSTYAALRLHGVDISSVIVNCGPSAVGGTRQRANGYPCLVVYAAGGNDFTASVPDAGLAVRGVLSTGEHFPILVDDQDPTVVSDRYNVTNDVNAGSGTLAEGLVIAVLFGVLDFGVVAWAVAAVAGRRNRRRAAAHAQAGRHATVGRARS